MERLSDRLTRMSQACGGDTVTLRSLLHKPAPRDHALVALFVALCSLPPIPMPGLSIVFALVAMTAGGRMALGLEPWLPSRLLDRPLPARPPGRLLAWAAGALRRAAPLIRPRGDWASSRPWAWRAHGAAIAACGAMLLIPLPPPTNIPPAGSMLLLCLGVLEGDGLVLGLGYLAAALTAALFTAVACLGVSGLRSLLSV
jgi:hypothetical protein